MAKVKQPAKKQRLAKRLLQTRWAPFWTVPKIYGNGRRVHMGRHTVIKRSWNRGKNTKA
jgi:ribosomal protein L39E